MNEVSQRYDQLIKSTVDYCNRMLETLKQISLYIAERNKDIETGVYVDMTEIIKKQEEARIIKKRIYENMATIGFYSGKIELDNDDFNGYADKVMRNGIHISNTLFDIISREEQMMAGSIIPNVSIQFKNIGYNQWDSENTKLKISIYNNELLINLTTEVLLNSQQAIQTGEMAEFIANVTLPNTKGVYTVNLSVIDPLDNHEYCAAEKYGLNITSLT